jgi:predicted glycosyltransferase
MRLRDLGALDVLLPERLSPAALARWLAAGSAERPARPRIDMDGLRRLPALLDALLARPPKPAERGAITPTRRFTRTFPATATSTRSVSA